MDRLVNAVVRRVIIEGSSMAPTYQSGERVTAVRRWRHVRVGDVVVLRDPREESRWILKRCRRVLGRQLDLRGDNELASTDSRDFGLVAENQVAYIVLEPRARVDSIENDAGPSTSS